MKTPIDLRGLLLLTALTALAAAPDAQRGGRSLSSGSSSSGRSSFSSGGSRGFSGGSISSRPSFPSRPSYSPPSSSRGSGFGSRPPVSVSPTPGRSSAPSYGGGRSLAPVTIPRGSSGTSYRGTDLGGYRGAPSTGYLPPVSGADDAYRPSGSDLYRSRGADAPDAGAGADLLGRGGIAGAEGGPAVIDVAPSARARTTAFPRAWSPTPYTPRSYTPAGGDRSGYRSDAARDVGEIAARYGRLSERGGGLDGGASSGGVVGDRTGYTRGPLGRLDPSTRLRGGQGDAPSARDGSGGSASVTPSVPGTGERASRRPAAGGLDAGETALGPGGARFDRARGGPIEGTRIVSPGSSGGGYVTPGGSPVITAPTVTKGTLLGFYGYGYGPGCSFSWRWNPCFYWGWYAWCAPFGFYNSFLYWYYPPTRYVYVGGPSTVTVYERVVSEPGTTVVVEDGPGEPGQRRAPDFSIAAERYLTLGDRSFREGRYGDAVHFYAKAVELAPNEGALYLILADALFATGDYHYAAYAVRKALELDPALLDSAVDKHAFYGNPDDFDRQLATLEQFVRDHPGDLDARLLLALNLYFGSRATEARDVLESPFSAGLRGDPAVELLREAVLRAP